MAYRPVEGVEGVAIFRGILEEMRQWGVEIGIEAVEGLGVAGNIHRWCATRRAGDFRRKSPTLARPREAEAWVGLDLRPVVFTVFQPFVSAFQACDGSHRDANPG